VILQLVLPVDGSGKCRGYATIGATHTMSKCSYCGNNGWTWSDAQCRNGHSWTEYFDGNNQNCPKHRLPNSRIDCIKSCNSCSGTR